MGQLYASLFSQSKNTVKIRCPAPVGFAKYFIAIFCIGGIFNPNDISVPGMDCAPLAHKVERHFYIRHRDQFILNMKFERFFIKWRDHQKSGKKLGAYTSVDLYFSTF